MISETAGASRPGSRPLRPRAGWLASVALCGILPAVVLVLLFASTIGDGSAAIDFRPFQRAADAVLSGETPYPAEDALLTASAGPYVYPPLPALLTVPLSPIPVDVLAALVMALQVVLVVVILRILDVRDWRCYGVAFLWPPVLSAIQTGNVTLWLALAAAVAWRTRDRLVPTGASLGAALAVKFFLWPLLVWLLATRRVLGAVVATGVAGVLVLGSWAAIGFAGIREYPELLRRLEEAVGDDAYTLPNLVAQLGGSEAAGRAAWLVFGGMLLVWCVVLGLRGDERSSFVLALAAALVLSPLVWLHYFALLLVAVALARQRLAPIWFVPLAMYVATGSEDPSALQLATTLAAGAITVAFALRDTVGEERRPAPLASPSQAAG